MVSNLAKAAIGVTGVASVGATAIYFTSGNSKEQEKPKSKPLVKVESLIQEGKRLLTKQDDDGKWTPLWNQFKEKNNQKPTGVWKFETWPQSKESLLNSFKDQCVNFGAKNVEIETDPIVTEVNAYCVTEKEK